MSAKLAAQLLTMHRTDTLRALLQSLNEQTLQGWKLYWCDNGSTDEEHEVMQSIVREVKPNFEIVSVRNSVNTGFDGGHEMLYQMHDAEFVALLNDDAFLTPTYFEELVKVLDTRPKVAAVSGVILRWHFDADRQVVRTNIVDSMGLSCGWSQWTKDIAAGKVFSMTTMPNEAWKFANGEVGEVFGVSGCLPMYRRSAIGVQLFDPEYFYYKEDVDVAYRLRGKGFVSAIAYGAKAYHQRTFKPSLSHRGVAYKKLFCSYRNHLWNLRKHLSPMDWLKYGWCIVPFEIAKIGYLLLTHPTIIWRVWFGNSSVSSVK